MKFVIVFVAMTLASGGLWSQSIDVPAAYLFTSFQEPADKGLQLLYSMDGCSWERIDTTLLTPSLGSQSLMRDPSMVQGPDGTFHLVWTTSWKGDNGFGYASSKDLIDWSEQRMLPVMAHEPTAVNAWAPEIFYDAAGDRFIIIWASCIPGRFERGLEDERNNHRMYVTTTRDFRDFTPTRLFLDPGFSVIDAVIVKRDDKDYVLVLKDNTRPQRNLKVAFSASPLGPWANVSEPFTDSFTEGPGVVRIGDEWLVYFDSYRKKTYEAVATKDFANFQSANGRISIPEGHKHGTIVKVDPAFLSALRRKTGR